MLADDDYITIAQGVFDGRTFFDNLRKGVKYYLAVKLALVLIFLLPVLAGVPFPFSPIQIILLELFMDLMASTTFVLEPAERTIYTARPERKAGPVRRKHDERDRRLRHQHVRRRHGAVFFLRCTPACPSRRRRLSHSPRGWRGR